MNTISINLTPETLDDFVNIANTFKSDIDIKKGSYIIDGKSILGIMSLDYTEGIEARIITTDENELERFTNEIKQFM